MSRMRTLGSDRFFHARDKPTGADGPTGADACRQPGSTDKHAVRASAQASRRLFELAGVEMRHYEPEKESLQLPLRYQPREGTCVSCGGPGLRVGQVHGHGHGGHEGHSRASGLGQWAQWAQWAPWMLAAGFALGEPGRGSVCADAGRGEKDGKGRRVWKPMNDCTGFCQ
ncbi:unnamed protein product [Effrenium voratum]|nr:unnamed protein product [Effrenium voratum]